MVNNCCEESIAIFDCNRCPHKHLVIDMNFLLCKSKKRCIINSQMQGALLSVPNNQPVYSVYTNKIICYGNVPYGTICDAPLDHPNYGKPYHNIQYIVANETYYAHDRHMILDNVSFLNKNISSNLANVRSLYVSDSRPNNFWLGRNTQQHTSTGSYHSSPYYKSSASRKYM